MRVIAHPEKRARRGLPVVEGNVYTNANGRPHYKIVLGIIPRDERGRPWNNVALLKVFADGSLAGCAMEPEAYMRDHQDLVGKVSDMPSLKIEWFDDDGS